MKVGEFCDVIGVSQNAYRRFMSQNGKFAGAGCDTYQNAWEFFRKRDMAGLKMPKEQKTSDFASSAGAALPSEAAAQDMSQIHLDGKSISTHSSVWGC